MEFRRVICRYLGYLLFFPNFLAGTSQRYEHLAPQLAAAPPPPKVQAFREGLARMLGGYFGAIVISGLAWSAFEQCRPATATDAGPAGGLALAGACLAFTVHQIGRASCRERVCQYV